MEQPDSWQVMATYAIQYEEEAGTVDVVQLTHRTPDFLFHVCFPVREILLSLFAERPQLWNGSPVTMAEARALGESIVRQIGYRLPSKACNNPFEYKGDIEVVVERFRIDTLLIERAKAPYTDDIYYRIVFSPDRDAVLVNMGFLGARIWTCDRGFWQNEETFNLFKSMLINFEEAYQRGIYRAEP